MLISPPGSPAPSSMLKIEIQSLKSITSRINHIIVSLSFFLFASSSAQVKNSVYSMFGVGQPIDNSIGMNKSLGGTGIAFQSGASVNYRNPASYLGIPPNSVTMELGLYGIYSNAESKSVTQSDGNINIGLVSASLYLAEWWALSAGIVPFSSVDYEVQSNEMIQGDRTSFTKRYLGTGGLSQLYLGNSFNIYEGLSAGFNASYIFGPITQTEIAESNSSFSGYELTNKRTAYGFYADYGLQYSLRQSDWQYTIGLIYGATTRLGTTDELVFTYEGVTDSLERGKQPDITIPQKFGVGISARTDKLRFGFDYEWKNWSTINFSHPNLETKNSNRYSAGVEYNHGSLLYRLGAHYRNSYLEIDNTQINSTGVSGGVGIPFSTASYLNLSVEYGTEGTLNKGLIKNNYWMLYVSVSFRELWVSLTDDD
jgi:hypothetical protein